MPPTEVLPLPPVPWQSSGLSSLLSKAGDKGSHLYSSLGKPPQAPGGKTGQSETEKAEGQCKRARLIWSLLWAAEFTPS